jgi:flagella basal body P-ring formation protein FlgA
MRIVPVLVAVLVVVASAAADSIILRGSVRLPAGADEVVRLADIAQLEGPEAQRLAQVEVGRLSAAGTLEITIEELRTTLDAAGARWASIDLSGRAASVRRSEPRPEAMAPMKVAPLPQKPAVAPAPPKQVHLLVSEALGLPTPRGLIADLLAVAHARRDHRLRFTVDAADLPFLDEIRPGIRYEITPLTSVTVDRVVVRVIARNGDQIADRREISLRPEFEVDAAVATSLVRRGTALDSAPLEIGATWVPPSEVDRVVSPDRLVGAVAIDAIQPGARVLLKDIKRDADIRRNQVVSVRRELDLVAIELQAIALEDGSVGDVIRLQIVDRRSRRDHRTFQAVVVGPGQAVIR